jgi:FlaG/FlaF family flagellin (archaellin)
MKGVSAVIAIILILMIVVALTALAYTWFREIFGGLTVSANNATSTATTSLSMKMRIDVVKYYPGFGVNATIRNIGTVDIDMSKLGIYIDGSYCPVYAPSSGKLTPGLTNTIKITNTTAACYYKVLKVSLETGFEDYKTITCSIP